MAELPPNPASYPSPEAWQRDLYQYLVAQTRVSQENNPLPVLLPHQTTGQLARAAVDGLMMYDPTLGAVVVSKGGVWVRLAEVP